MEDSSYSRRDFLTGGMSNIENFYDDDRAVTNEKVRGVYLAGLMVTSVFAGTVVYASAMRDEEEKDDYARNAGNSTNSTNTTATPTKENPSSMLEEEEANVEERLES